jgi:anti-sigma factor RsiW
MSDPEIQILLMGYVDGELDDAQRARVEHALADDAELRRELEEMRRLKDLTRAVRPDAESDEELSRFWGDVYNRLERNTAWMLLLFGFSGIIAAGCYLFFTHPWPHWSIKVAGACGAVGTFLLLWSLWRERRRVLPHDRYSREVHR